TLQLIDVERVAAVADERAFLARDRAVHVDKAAHRHRLVPHWPALPPIQAFEDREEAPLLVARMAQGPGEVNGRHFIVLRSYLCGCQQQRSDQEQPAESHSHNPLLLLDEGAMSPR